MTQILKPILFLEPMPSPMSESFPHRMIKANNSGETEWTFTQVTTLQYLQTWDLQEEWQFSSRNKTIFF